MTKSYSRRDGIHVHRWVDTESPDLQEFTNRMGQALRGKGNTYSLGTMTLSVLTDAQFQKVVNRMSVHDQSHLELPSLEGALNEALKDRPKDPDVDIDGLGLYGKVYRRGKAVGIGKLAFVIPDDNEVIKQDIEAVCSVFDEFNLPAPSYANTSFHITMGEVYLARLLKGQGENPHTLMPSRLCVPEAIAMNGLRAEIVEKGSGV